MSVPPRVRTTGTVLAAALHEISGLKIISLTDAPEVIRKVESMSASGRGWGSVAHTLHASEKRFLEIRKRPNGSVLTFVEGARNARPPEGDPLNDGYPVPPQPRTDQSPGYEACRYPLFETMLRSMGLKLQATYTCQDIASLFGVTARTIQSKAADGTLPSRELIGGGRFLPIDIENYLRTAGDGQAGASQ